MNVKEKIAAFIKKNENLIQFREETKQVYTEENDVLALYLEKLVNTKFNLALGPDLILLLQVTNDKLLIEEYELEDIRKLYKSLIQVSEYDLDTYLEAAHFEWSVMDEKDKAEQIISSGLEKAKQKIEELKKLQDSINSET